MPVIEEVINWATDDKQNKAFHPVGPQGRTAARTSYSFQEMQAAIARWRDSLGGNSPLTTKGDLFTFSTVDARLPVGTNGQVLSANAGEVTGLEWIDAPAGTIGGSITDNQIAVGAATANDIEGTATLTYNSTYLKIDDVAPFGVMLTSTSSGTNAKKFSFDNYLGIAGIRFWNDAETSPTELVTYQRTGTTVTTVTHQGNTFRFFPDTTDGGIEFSHNTIKLGDPVGGGQALIVNPLTSMTLKLASGNLNFGSWIELNGSSATNANDIVMGHGTNFDVFTYDYSAGSLTLRSGGATTAVAATFDSTQNLALTNYINGYGGTPADGEVLTWVTANGRAEFAAAGGGAIGGSITDNQVAIGATTANDIEGSTSLTFDSATEKLTLGAGSVAVPELEINASAAGTPTINFDQNSVNRATIRWQNAGSVLSLNSSGDLDLRAGNSSAILLDTTTQNASFSNYISGYGGTQSDGQVLTWVTANNRAEFVTPASGIGGSIAVNQVAVGSAANEISGDAALEYIESGFNQTLTIGDATNRNPQLILDQQAGNLGVGSIFFHHAGVQMAAIEFFPEFDILQVGCTVSGSDTTSLLQLLADNVAIQTLNREGTTFERAVRFRESVTDPFDDEAQFGQLYVKNDPVQKLIFVNDAGGETILAGEGAPAIGGSITDNQIAVGAATANEIEGSAGFLWDATNMSIGTVTTNTYGFNTPGSMSFGIDSTDVRTDRFFEWGSNSSGPGFGWAIHMRLSDGAANQAELEVFGNLKVAAGTTSAASINIAEGVAPTTPVDGDVWVTAAGAFNARLNGVTVDLADAGTIGGSITDNQIAVGAATANDIEGSSALTMSGAVLALTIAGNPVFRLDGAATGQPIIEFMQNTVQKAYIQYIDSGDIFAIDSDGDIELRPGNSTTTGIQMPASGAYVDMGNYRFNTDQTVGAGQDNYVLKYDDASGEIGLEATTFLSEELKVKSADESVTSSTTLQDDNDLTVTLDANSYYRITCMLWILSASSTPDFKYDWVEPDGTWVNLRADNGNEITRGYQAASTGVLTMIGTIPEAMSFDFVVATAGTGGTFKLQWAQNTSNATATTVKAGSYMLVQKMA